MPSPVLPDPACVLPCSVVADAPPDDAPDEAPVSPAVLSPQASTPHSPSHTVQARIFAMLPAPPGPVNDRRHRAISDATPPGAAYFPPCASTKNFPAALPSIFPTMPMRWWSDGVVMLAPTIPLASMMSLHVPSLPHEKRAATFEGVL